MPDAQGNGLSTSTLTRLLIGAMGVLLLAGLSFWANTISGQIGRIENNTDKQISSIEMNLRVLRDTAVVTSDRNSAKLTDLQIELKVAQMKIQQLELAVEKAEHTQESPRK